MRDAVDARDRGLRRRAAARRRRRTASSRSTPSGWRGSRRGAPVLLVATQMRSPRVRARAVAAARRGGRCATLRISARTGEGVEALLARDPGAAARGPAALSRGRAHRSPAALPRRRARARGGVRRALAGAPLPARGRADRVRRARSAARAHPRQPAGRARFAEADRDRAGGGACSAIGTRRAPRDRASCSGTRSTWSSA